LACVLCVAPRLIQTVSARFAIERCGRVNEERIATLHETAEDTAIEEVYVLRRRLFLIAARPRRMPA
jgi:hypothetical protein